MWLYDDWSVGGDPASAPSAEAGLHDFPRLSAAYADGSASRVLYLVAVACGVVTAVTPSA